MPLTRLKFAPGIVKDQTNYSAAGTWVDGNLVRFKDGYPEKWRGWVKISIDNFLMDGMCRSLHRFSDLTGLSWMGAGTSQRFYVVSDDIFYEVTPYRSSPTLGSNPLATTSGSGVIVVTHNAHGRYTGDYVVLSGAATTNGIANTVINAEYEITYLTDNTYSISTAGTASSTGSGGGASVVANYIYHAGSDDAVSGGGFGTLSFGEEEWGGDPAAGTDERIGIWSQANWGEDLVACPAGGPIFYWDATSPSARMINIRSLGGADGNAPTYAEFILVSHKDRHLLAFGGNLYGGSTPGPMTLRWCSQETITNWDESSTTGTAGSLPFSIGSKFISAIQTANEILVWTDQALYSLRYLGAPLIYGAELIEGNSDIVGLKAATTHSNAAFWMGRSGFHVYTGRVEKLSSPVWDYVLQDMNWEQCAKVFCSTNRKAGEVIWFYPSVDGTEIDSYVSFNPQEQYWTTGSLARTAWLDLDALNEPYAASTDGYLYAHEIGSDDGSTSPATAINAYIESAPFELSSEGSFDKGDRFMFIRRIFPDISFRDYTGTTPNPQVTFTLKMLDKPGSGVDYSSGGQVTRTATIPVETFTDAVDVRLRGRAMVLRVESTTTGSLWRLGVPRIDVRTDGQRG